MNRKKILIQGGDMPTFNPDMLRIARDLRGMSQTELVQKMGNITQAALSKIEKGDIKPSDETKFNIAKTLNFPERFFTKTTTLKCPQLVYMLTEKSFNYN